MIFVRFALGKKTFTTEIIISGNGWKSFFFKEMLHNLQHVFHFLQVCKTSKNMFFIFCKLNKLKKHVFHLLQAQKTWISFFCKLAKPEKTCFT
eukprot:UN24016